MLRATGADRHSYRLVREREFAVIDRMQILCTPHLSADELRTVLFDTAHEYIPIDLTLIDEEIELTIHFRVDATNSDDDHDLFVGYTDLGVLVNVVIWRDDRPVRFKLVPRK